MAQADIEYHNLLKNILENGFIKGDRTGTGSKSIFGTKLYFDLTNNKIPLLTTKKMFTKGIVYELFWFLGYHMRLPEYKEFGLTNLKWLVDNNVNIWIGDAYKKYTKCEVIDESNGYTVISPRGHYTHETKENFIDQIKTNNIFAKQWGELGPIYGKQWINWQVNEAAWINQIQQLIHDLKNNPDSRRLLVTAWNPADVNKTVLPPCHYGFQCWTRELSLEERIQWVMKNCDIDLENLAITEEALSDRTPKRALSLQWHQRSVDTPLGLPFNIASYAILTHMLARTLNMVAERLIFDGGDTHIYLNQINEVEEQLLRSTTKHEAPTIKFNTNETDIWKLNPSDIKIENYTSEPTIDFPLSN